MIFQWNAPGNPPLPAVCYHLHIQRFDCLALVVKSKVLDILCLALAVGRQGI